MQRQHIFRIHLVALLGLALASTVVVAQAKPNAASPQRKSSPTAARTVSTIKCVDPDSMIACKSFKQLVDARDKSLLGSLTGDKDSRERHFAYVCLRLKKDAFKVLEFDEPLPEEYRPYSPPDAVKNPVSWVQEQDAFPYIEGVPVMQHMDAQKKWYEDHDDFSVYDFGKVYLESWGSGIMSDYVSGYGKWKRPVPQAHGRSQEGATFESAHQWLAHFNHENENKLAAVDDRERPRVLVDDTNIYLHYSFRNKSNDYTDYTLNIQRSTGRFTESFSAPSVDPFDESGTCMILKY
jgi:hypothetical protein